MRQIHARPRWQSVLKWIGLWLIASLIGGGASALVGRSYAPLLAAVVLIGMIGWHLKRREDGHTQASRDSHNENKTAPGGVVLREEGYVLKERE